MFTKIFHEEPTDVLAPRPPRTGVVLRRLEEPVLFPVLGQPLLRLRTAVRELYVSLLETVLLGPLPGGRVAFRTPSLCPFCP